LDKLKEYWFYAHHFFEGGDVLYRQVIKSNTPDHYHAAVHCFLNQAPTVKKHLTMVSDDF
jgi:hypothetical protein